MDAVLSVGNVGCHHTRSLLLSAFDDCIGPHDHERHFFANHYRFRDYEMELENLAFNSDSSFSDLRATPLMILSALPTSFISHYTTRYAWIVAVASSVLAVFAFVGSILCSCTISIPLRKLGQQIQKINDLSLEDVDFHWFSFYFDIQRIKEGFRNAVIQLREVKTYIPSYEANRRHGEKEGKDASDDDEPVSGGGEDVHLSHSSSSDHWTGSDSDSHQTSDTGSATSSRELVFSNSVLSIASSDDSGKKRGRRKRGVVSRGASTLSLGWKKTLGGATVVVVQFHNFLQLFDSCQGSGYSMSMETTTTLFGLIIDSASRMESRFSCTLLSWSLKSLTFYFAGSTSVRRALLCCLELKSKFVSLCESLCGDRRNSDEDCDDSSCLEFSIGVGHGPCWVGAVGSVTSRRFDTLGRPLDDASFLASGVLERGGIYTTQEVRNCSDLSHFLLSPCEVFWTREDGPRFVVFELEGEAHDGKCAEWAGSVDMLERVQATTELGNAACAAFQKNSEPEILQLFEDRLIACIDGDFSNVKNSIALFLSAVKGIRSDKVPIEGVVFACLAQEERALLLKCWRSFKDQQSRQENK